MQSNIDLKNKNYSDNQIRKIMRKDIKVTTGKREELIDITSQVTAGSPAGCY